MLFWMWCVCFLHCLVKKQQNNLIHSYITLWCVLNAVCVLCNARKRNCRPVKNILTTPSGVFWILCVFLALPVSETADQFNTFLHRTLVYFEWWVCSLCCPVKKQQTFVIYFYITLWCVFKCRLRFLHCLVTKQQTSLTYSYITLWCVLNGEFVPCAVR
jgi:hypothetical protein